ncbi:hypothetical protein BDZ89DRAFT_1053129 [Hymenopellis radicata]|nr:hypothetical protein BDZ89DRAFT_1053129 [Hymenopellis radicata]
MTISPTTTTMSTLSVVSSTSSCRPHRDRYLIIVSGDRIVARDDPVNTFDFNPPTCLDPTGWDLHSGRRSSASGAATALSSHGSDSSITIKTSTPSGLSSPAASLATGSPWFSLSNIDVTWNARQRPLPFVNAAFNFHDGHVVLILVVVDLTIVSARGCRLRRCFVFSASRCRIRASLWRDFEPRPTQHPVRSDAIQNNSVRADVLEKEAASIPPVASQKMCKPS